MAEANLPNDTGAERCRPVYPAYPMQVIRNFFSESSHIMFIRRNVTQTLYKTRSIKQYFGSCHGRLCLQKTTVIRCNDKDIELYIASAD